jgi:hypothetical protein
MRKTTSKIGIAFIAEIQNESAICLRPTREPGSNRQNSIFDGLSPCRTLAGR